MPSADKLESTAEVRPKKASSSRASHRALARNAAREASEGHFREALATLKELEAGKGAGASLAPPLREMIKTIRDWQKTYPAQSLKSDEIVENRPLWVFPGGTGTYLPLKLCDMYMRARGQQCVYPDTADIQAASTREEFYSRLDTLGLILGGLQMRYKPSKCIVVGGSRFSMLAGIVAGEMKADACVVNSPITALADPVMDDERWAKGRKFAERFRKILPEGYRDMREISHSWREDMRLDVIYSTRSEVDIKRVALLEGLPNLHLHPNNKWVWHETYPLFFTSPLIAELSGDAVEEQPEAIEAGDASEATDMESNGLDVRDASASPPHAEQASA